jgi:metallo-beta-lactamase family protein
MHISFHGAAQMVTGSKHLITLNNGKKLLLDCGLFQGQGGETHALNSNFGFEPSEIDYVILSHAHIDHSGLLPKLVKDGYKGKIYATPATKQLASVLMEDSGNIHESEAKMRNKRMAIEGRPYVKPLYTVLDAMAAADRFEEVDYDIWFTIDENISFCFTDAGHIIGSAAVHIKITEDGNSKRITFSGDIGRYRDLILRSPAAFEQADYILLESTYGDSLHEQFAPSTEILLEWIEKTILNKKGKLIMPAFSVGRTQEILFALNELSLAGKLPEVEVFVDSPLSVKATNIIKSYPKYFNNHIQEVLRVDKDPFGFPGCHFIKTIEESKRLNYRKLPCIIISASGMAEAGRIKHHISNNIENKRNTILLTGYCEPNSLGGRLKRGDAEVKIFGQWHQVNAEVGQIRSMSAHGDYNDIKQFLSCQDASKVKKLFLVHGEPEVQQRFAKTLAAVGFEHIEIPRQHQKFDL